MATVSYRRVSSEDQSLDRQDLGECDKVFEDKASAGTKDRPGLTDLIEWVREGDTVKVWSIDRLARNLQDLLELVQGFLRKKVTVIFVKDGLTFSPDNSNPASTLYLQVLGAVAEFERALIRERQKEGIAKAKAKGVYRGRKPSVTKQEVDQLKQDGLSISDIARKLDVTRQTVYRYLS